MFTIFRVFGACALVLFMCNQASAVCAGFGVQNLPRYVGNTDKSSPGYDSKCTDNDIQSAINNTVCPNTPIYITGEHTYTQQRLVVSGKSISLVGSTEACGVTAAASTTPVRTLSGTSAGSVIMVNGNSDVTVQNLEITGGGNANNANSEGGGILFSGAGTLTLKSDTIDHNQADYGAGIDVSPTDATTVTLQTDTLILENTAATSGGGIRIEGPTRLFMLDDASTVSFNSAQSGYGGGIEVIGPARADIGSSGAVFAGAVSDNTAAYGGGIAIIGHDDDPGVARLFSTNATNAVEVSSNSATAQGGGIYVSGDPDNANGTGSFCAQDFRVDLNSAPDGAAIFSPGPFLSSSVLLNDGECGPEAPASLGAVPCALNTSCNEISGNAAKTSSGGSTDGSIVALSKYAALHANRFAMRQNSASQIIEVIDSGTEANDSNVLQNCLIVDNHSAHEIIHAESGFSSLSVNNCTVANNTIDDGYVIFAKAGLNLSNDLIAQPNNSTLDYEQGNTGNNFDCVSYAFCLFVKYVVASETASLLGPDFSLQSETPLFVDSTNADTSKRDYHLQAFITDGAVTASAAIDFAPTLADSGNDLDNHARDQDVPLVTNRFGMSDVGAYEMQPISDRIFADAFGDPTSLIQ